jgi:hypothetical protein
VRPLPQRKPVHACMHTYVNTHTQTTKIRFAARFTYIHAYIYTNIHTHKRTSAHTTQSLLHVPHTYLHANIHADHLTLPKVCCTFHIHTCMQTYTQIASHYQKFAARSAMSQEEKAKSSLLDQTTPRVQRILKGLEKPDFPGKAGDEKPSDA